MMDLTILLTIWDKHRVERIVRERWTVNLLTATLHLKGLLHQLGPKIKTRYANNLFYNKIMSDLFSRFNVHHLRMYPVLLHHHRLL